MLVFTLLQLNLTEIQLQKSDSNLAASLDEVRKNLTAKVNHMVVCIKLSKIQARFRRRSTHVPNLIELGSTLERHWRDN